MKSVYISDELHRRAKIQAAEEGRTLREFIEEHVKRGLERKPAEVARDVAAIKEQAITYQAETPIFVEAPISNDPLAALEAQGFIIRGERLREMLDTTFARIWKQLGVEPPTGPPPSIEEVRDIIARYQAKHPEVPSLSELVIQMREEY
ncbi:MAG: hypothetical protein H8D78_11655 [Chloroflexi bacterium]|nr:hypothetical protein [Chloroflexota bacterium]